MEVVMRPTQSPMPRVLEHFFKANNVVTVQRLCKLVDPTTQFHAAAMFVLLLLTLRIEVSTPQRLTEATYSAGDTCVAAAVVSHVTHQCLLERTLRNARII